LRSECTHQLSSAIRAEVCVDYDIGRRKPWSRGITKCDLRRHNELIAFAPKIRLLKGKLWATHQPVAAIDDRIKRCAGTLPARVSIHAVVTPTNRCNLC
jgi:hypothetical protein